MQIEINNLDTLQAMAAITDFTGMTFLQTDHIDCSGTQLYNYGTGLGDDPLAYNEPLAPGFNTGGEGWLSIGDTTNPFTVSYDGNNYNISGMQSVRADNWEACLFGKAVVGSVIKNVNMLGIDFTGAGGTAGICGNANFCLIEHCYVQGTIRGISTGGGMVSYGIGPTIRECEVNIAIVDALVNCGAFIGWARDGCTINRCAARGSVNGTSATGGFCGITSACEITNCYTSADIIATNGTGGFFGKTNADGNASNCYSCGSVVGTVDVGGFIGLKAGGTHTNCYYDQTASGRSDNDGRGVPVLAMDEKASFVNWDFNTIWKMIMTPMLRSLLHLNDAYSHGQNDAYGGDNNDAYGNGDNDIYNCRLNRVY